MKKGFTLIELLAVIVILAIIALIAVPTITGLVEKARKGSVEQSANGYVDAVDKQIALNLMDSDETNDINEGILDAPFESKYNVKVKGQTPTKGWVEVTKNGVNRYSLVIGEYVVTNNGDKVEVVKGTEPAEKPDVETIIYRYSVDELYNGDKIDLSNKKIVLHKQIQCNVNGVMTNSDEIDINNYTQEELSTIAKTCKNVSGEFKKSMHGIYSTKLSDVLTIKMNNKGETTEEKNNPTYLKHTINSEGVITKSETCLKTSWGTLCQTGGEGIYDETNDKWNDPNYETKKNTLLNFFKWNINTNSSEYEGFTCNIDSTNVYPNVYCHNTFLNFNVGLDGYAASQNFSGGASCSVQEDSKSNCM